MTFSNDAAIERVARGVIDRTLPKHDWTHAGHFAAALWLCRHRPGLTTQEEMRTLITRYNEATHTANTDTGGYHHTITLASVRAAADHLTRLPDDVRLHDALSALMASRYGNPNWLLDHWSHGLLFSVPGRRTWVEPDLSPLPF